MESRCSPGDPNSYARPDQCIVQQIRINLTINFTLHLLSGSVDLGVERQKKEVNNLILDTRDLDIQEVTHVETGKQLNFKLGKSDEAFGSPLEVQLPVKDPECLTVRIKYKTSPNASALQWLKPEQTAGKKHPYLFSQCQAIHARSIVPCQDTPSVKVTYTAKITAPKDLVVLMSAVRDGSDTDPKDSSVLIHKFIQKVPIPSYLLAIVAGALESRKIGPRSHVWSEKELLERAAFEFSETEAFIKVGEDLLGPYVWGVYDLLVLPPSFPYGGMENPCLTFVTPTLLAGDRSLANVIAHEIAHSWTGNLVTNANWEHFWLNEGHTVFVERKIVGKMSGGEKARHFEALGGWKDLLETISHLGSDNVLTNLVVNLTGVDPDDAFSNVPYEKGSSLLFYLETLLGGPAVFEPWMRHYISTMQYKSLTTEEWKSMLYEYFKEKKDVLDKVDWNAWFNTPGMPPLKPEFDTTYANACTKLRERWVQAGSGDFGPFTNNDIKDMSSKQKVEFLAQLLLEDPLPIEKLEAMDKLYSFSDIANSEIRFRWLRLGLRAKWDNSVQGALKMVTEQGRMKFTRPLYRDLYAFEKHRQQTLDVFRKNRAFMHSTTAELVAKDLQLTLTKL